MAAEDDRRGLVDGASVREPERGKFRGDMCGTCGSVASSVGRMSRIGGPERPSEFRGILAAGDWVCDLVLALAKT